MAQAKSKDGQHMLLLNDGEVTTAHFGALLALKQAAAGQDIALPTIKNAIAIHEALSPISDRLAAETASKKLEKEKN